MVNKSTVKESAREQKVKKTLSDYAFLVHFQPKVGAEANGLNYNTLKATMGGPVNIKLVRLIEAVSVLFPEVEPGIFPGLPKELSKHLTRNELAARIFAAMLDSDKDRMRAVGELLIALSGEAEPGLEELLELAKNVR